MSENQESDGLDNFSMEQIGQRTGAFGGARLLKYVTDHFVTREGEVIDPSREMIVLGLKKVVQKFVAQKLVDTIVVPDNEKMPDVAAMNEAAPREEWGTDLNGNPVGPYVRVLVLKMLDAKTMDRFAFVTSSVGGSIAVGDLSDKTQGHAAAQWSQRRARRVVRDHQLQDPIQPEEAARLSCAALDRARRRRGGGLPKPESAKSLAAPSSVGKALGIGTPVAEPTLKQETGDEVPF